MRKMTDKNGVELHIDTINGTDAYSGMLEGTPYLASKMRLSVGRSGMNDGGTYVDGLDRLERELDAMPRDHDIWPPNERWSARIVTPTRTGSNPDMTSEDVWICHRHFMTVDWYQQGGDPLTRLTDIVAGLDFMQHCQAESWGV